MITALITNYNIPPELLKRCVDSVERFGLDCLIVDDCSDNTDHLDVYQKVIKLPENVGTYAAFDIGIGEIDTEYIMRVDADDYITGVPHITGEYDAYINNIDGKVSLDPKVFLSRPYAGFNGATVKTTVLKEMWFSGVRYYGDIINFMRLISRYKCVINDEQLYVYERRKSGSITTMNEPKRQKHINYAKQIAKKELEEFKNGR